MQRSKPERASDVDEQATLEDVFSSTNFGKELPDPLSLVSASAMADATGPRAAGIVKNRFIATVSVAAAVLSLAVVAVSTGTVRAPSLSAENAGRARPVEPRLLQPRLERLGVGQRQHRGFCQHSHATTVDADEPGAGRRAGLDDARQRDRHRGRLHSEQQR